MSGTDKAYAVCLRYQLTVCYAMSGTDIAYAATSADQCAEQVKSAICLRACYATSSTDIAYAAICLRACYAVSVTDLAYAASSRWGSTTLILRQD
eukprot:3375935-Rhodomonas_salina.5